LKMPHPFLHVDFRIHRAASGGPIFTSRGEVVGVNTSEIEGEPGVAFGTQIRCLQDAYLDNAIPAAETTPRAVCFSELVSTGWLAIPDYRYGAIPRQCGSVIRLDEIPVSAPTPALGLSIRS
jgi:S1-C subfamily serine protease